MEDMVSEAMSRMQMEVTSKSKASVKKRLRVPKGASSSQLASRLPSTAGMRHCGLDQEAYEHLKASTGLSDEELISRFDEFNQQFPSGRISLYEFKALSSCILDADEVDSFCKTVFKIFDANNDAELTFDEFTIATSAKLTNTQDKLKWLFDHVYDKNHSGRVSKQELRDILMTLLRMENIGEARSKELVDDIFRDLDLNKDGLINKKEFIGVTSQSYTLLKILSHAADQEIKLSSSDTNAPATSGQETDKVVEKKKKKRKKKKIVVRDPMSRRPSSDLSFRTYGIEVKSLLDQSKERESKTSSTYNKLL